MKQDLFYKKCALLLKKVLTKRMTLKNACYSTNNPKQYFAVIKNTLDNIQMIEQVYNQLKHKKENEKYVNFIKIYEILSKNYKQNDKFFKEIQIFVKDLNLKKKEECIKYFRINNFKKENISFSFEETDIKNVYKTKEILDYKLINEGKIIVQNYSSCLPAQILNPPEGSTVLDVCAAPGNKTLHLAQIMNNTGKIYAIEKDCKRFLILEKLVKRSGFTNITTIQGDCLNVDTSVFKDVKYVLVDPSCSGSGLHSIYSKNEERVKNLQNFQVAVINHFLKIDSVNKLVYSTCSEHEEENEEVVKLVLENNFDFELEKITGYNLGRGNSDYDFSDKVIRIKKNEEENITGFFVALFVRKK